MRYFGGKARIGKQIAEHINQTFGEYSFLTTYWEPFCGACSVMEHVEFPERIASDAHEDLILLWKELQQGWIPPATISEQEYNEAKDLPTSALRGFIGFGCSNSGKWFGGYARESTERNFATNARNSLLRKIKKLQDVEFYHADYRYLPFPKDWVIYCDPPYDGTTGYSTGRFNHEIFWDWIRAASEDNVVLVSEYEAPDDFEVVWEKNVKTDMNKADRRSKHERVERLFQLPWPF